MKDEGNEKLPILFILHPSSFILLISAFACTACVGCATALAPVVWQHERQPPRPAVVQPPAPAPAPSQFKPGNGAQPAESPSGPPIASTPSPLPASPPAGCDAPQQVSPASRDSAPLVNTVVPAIVPEQPASPALGEPFAAIRRLHREAVASYAVIDSYNVRLRRREQVNGKNKPEEVILFSFRKEPWSVHFKWIGETGKGREVVYVKGQYENKIHTLLAAGDNILLKAGTRFSLSPDSPLIRNESRHSISDAGVGHLIDNFGTVVEAAERGNLSLHVKYLGLARRSELGTPVEAVQNDIPPGIDPQLPHGGRCLWYFDPANHLPVLFITYDERGQEVEFYCYDFFQFPVKLDDRDFNPDLLWPAKLK